MSPLSMGDINSKLTILLNYSPGLLPNNIKTQIAFSIMLHRLDSTNEYHGG